jgi:hypothetical protein
MNKKPAWIKRYECKKIAVACITVGIAILMVVINMMLNIAIPSGISKFGGM